MFSGNLHSRTDSGANATYTVYPDHRLKKSENDNDNIIVVILYEVWRFIYRLMCVVFHKRSIGYAVVCGDILVCGGHKHLKLTICVNSARFDF